MVVCCIHPPSPTLGISPNVIPPHPPLSPYPTLSLPCPANCPQCVMILSLIPCVLIHCSTPTSEWEHAVFDVLFLCQFAENDGFQIHPCPCKGHELIVFYGCIIFHGIYVLHFPCPVYHQWAFGLVPGLCYCKQSCNEHLCACVLVVEQFIILWGYTQ